MLPERTGGRTIVGRNDPEQVVPAIFTESEAYYVLGIERAATDRPDRVRSIEVKVNRRGLRAYTQRKYVAPSIPQAAASVRVARRAADDAGCARPVDADGPRAARTGRDDVRQSRRRRRRRAGERRRDRIRARRWQRGSARRRGARGRWHGKTHGVGAADVDDLGRTPVGRDRRGRLRGVAPDVAAGQYGIRVAVAEPATGRIATVFSDVTVPDFAHARLSLSSVNVNVAHAPSAAAESTLRRVFRRTDQVRAALQIYQGIGRTDPIVPVSIRVQIVDTKGATVREQSLPFTETMFTNRRADGVMAIPVANLAPGEYLLKLQASASGQQAGRALRFTVE